jgi:CRP-like cAMP-binding protein
MGSTNEHTRGSAGVWGGLFAGRRAESYTRDSTIYTPEDAADRLFLVESGQVSLHLRSPEGRPLTLRVVEPGAIFGHVAVGDGGQYDSFAEALVASRLLQVPAHDVPGVLVRDPALGVALLADVAQHRAIVSERIDDVSFKSVPARLASLLLEMAQRQGGPHADYIPRHSHRQLAEMINAYRETVTKVINQFRDARLLEIERTTITLLNLRRLEELAQS